MILKHIHEQVVVIFGATSGIGLQTAIQMAQEGTRLALIGRNQQSVDQAVDLVRQEARTAHVMQSAETSFSDAGFSHSDSGPLMGGSSPTMDETTVDQQIIGLVADAANWDQVKSAADQAMTHFGRIDTWVQAAGISEWALFEDTSPEEFRQIIDVNLTGMAYGAMAALPYLKQQMGGAIIFISSVAGRTPVPYQSAYSASKHGVVAMSNVLRMEMAHEGVPVSVTTILPTSINTPLFNKGRTKLGVEPQPIPPVYAPELVADAIIYAAQHPVREITVGGAGWLMQVVRRLSPALANAYMGTASFEQQRSDQVKTAIAPDNLFSHVEGYNHVDGEYGMKSKRFSPQLWFATHPKARLALKVALLGGLGFAAYRVIDSRRQPSAWKQVKNQVQKQVKKQVKFAKDRLPIRLPIRRKKSRFAGLAEVLTSLPIISMLPFFNKPSLKERLQRGVQKGVDKIPVQETVQQTQKMLKRAQDRLPIEETEKMVEKIQERIPRRRERVLKETTIKNLPDRVDVDVRVSQREARRAEKLTSRM